MTLRLLFSFSIFLILFSVTTLSIRPQATPQQKQHSEIPLTPTKSSRVPTKTPDPTPSSFYQLIIDNNIFRPLGWRVIVRQPQYQLIGTFTNTERHKAIILDKHSNQLHTLQENDTIGDVIIEQIESKRVILRQDDTPITLSLSYAFLR